MHKIVNSDLRQNQHSTRTAESRSSVARINREGNLFVIQLHQAADLHYDLRLEVSGLLKSWMVPKGPSLDPRDRRLAILTEDYPLANFNFEGVIPEGDIGAGTVIVWDVGTFENLRLQEEDSMSIEESLRDGKILLSLSGKKLSGGFALTRNSKSERSQWLLMKLDDDHADARRNPVSTQPESVISGRTIENLNYKHCGLNPEDRA